MFCLCLRLFGFFVLVLFCLFVWVFWVLCVFAVCFSVLCCVAPWWLVCCCAARAMIVALLEAGVLCGMDGKGAFGEGGGRVSLGAFLRLCWCCAVAAGVLRCVVACAVFVVFFFLLVGLLAAVGCGRAGVCGVVR